MMKGDGLGPPPTDGNHTSNTKDPPPPVQLRLPMVDLEHFAQDELQMLARVQSSRLADLYFSQIVAPELDARLFNESAGGKKQTYRNWEDYWPREEEGDGGVRVGGSKAGAGDQSQQQQQGGGGGGKRGKQKRKKRAAQQKKKKKKEEEERGEEKPARPAGARRERVRAPAAGAAAAQLLEAPVKTWTSPRRAVASETNCAFLNTGMGALAGAQQVSETGLGHHQLVKSRRGSSRFAEKPAEAAAVPPEVVEEKPELAGAGEKRPVQAAEEVVKVEQEEEEVRVDNQEEVRVDNQVVEEVRVDQEEVVRVDKAEEEEVKVVDKEEEEEEVKVVNQEDGQGASVPVTIIPNGRVQGFAVPPQITPAREDLIVVAADCDGQAAAPDHSHTVDYQSSSAFQERAADDPTLSNSQALNGVQTQEPLPPPPVSSHHNLIIRSQEEESSSQPLDTGADPNCELCISNGAPERFPGVNVDQPGPRPLLTGEAAPPEVCWPAAAAALLTAEDTSTRDPGLPQELDNGAPPAACTAAPPPAHQLPPPPPDCEACRICIAGEGQDSAAQISSRTREDEDVPQPPPPESTPACEDFLSSSSSQQCAVPLDSQDVCVYCAAQESQGACEEEDGMRRYQGFRVPPETSTPAVPFAGSHAADALPLVVVDNRCEREECGAQQSQSTAEDNRTSSGMRLAFQDDNAMSVDDTVAARGVQMVAQGAGEVEGLFPPPPEDREAHEEVREDVPSENREHTQEDAAAWPPSSTLLQILSRAGCVDSVAPQATYSTSDVSHETQPACCSYPPERVAGCEECAAEHSAFILSRDVESQVATTYGLLTEQESRRNLGQLGELPVSTSNVERIHEEPLPFQGLVDSESGTSGVLMLHPSGEPHMHMAPPPSLEREAGLSEGAVHFSNASYEFAPAADDNSTPHISPQAAMSTLEMAAAEPTISSMEMVSREMPFSFMAMARAAAGLSSAEIATETGDMTWHLGDSEVSAAPGFTSSDLGCSVAPCLQCEADDVSVPSSSEDGYEDSSLRQAEVNAAAIASGLCTTGWMKNVVLEAFPEHSAGMGGMTPGLYHLDMNAVSGDTSYDSCETNLEPLRNELQDGVPTDGGLAFQQPGDSVIHNTATAYQQSKDMNHIGLPGLHQNGIAERRDMGLGSAVQSSSSYQANLPMPVQSGYTVNDIQEAQTGSETVPMIPAPTVDSGILMLERFVQTMGQGYSRDYHKPKLESRGGKRRAGIASPKYGSLEETQYKRFRPEIPVQSYLGYEESNNTQYLDEEQQRDGSDKESPLGATAVDASGARETTESIGETSELETAAPSFCEALHPSATCVAVSREVDAGEPEGLLQPGPSLLKGADDNPSVAASLECAVPQAATGMPPAVSAFDPSCESGVTHVVCHNDQSEQTLKNGTGDSTQVSGPVSAQPVSKAESSVPPAEPKQKDEMERRLAAIEGTWVTNKRKIVVADNFPEGWTVSVFLRTKGGRATLEHRNWKRSALAQSKSFPCSILCRLSPLHWILRT